MDHAGIHTQKNGFPLTFAQSVKPLQIPAPSQSTYRYQLTHNNHEDTGNDINYFLDICLHSDPVFALQNVPALGRQTASPSARSQPTEISLQKTEAERARGKLASINARVSAAALRWVSSFTALQTAFVYWVSCALECCSNEQCPCWALAAGPSWSAALLPTHSGLTAEFSLFHRAEIWPCSVLWPLLRNLSHGTKKSSK